MIDTVEGTAMDDAGRNAFQLGDFSLKYYGPALEEDSSLNARVLAPALLDLSDAIETAKAEVSSDSEIELRVRATEKGSFDIMMFLQAVGQFSNTVQGQGLEYLSNLGGVGFVAVIIGAIKYSKDHFIHGKGTAVKSVPTDNEDTTFSEKKTTIRYPDGTEVEYLETSMRIAQNRKFVNSAGKALAGPTNQDGVDGAELLSSGERVTVDKHVARNMAEWTPQEDIVSETDTDLTVQPLDAHFEPGKKWHVTVGGETKYSVDIADQEFLREIENGKRVGKKDIFMVTLHTVSSMGKDGKLKSSHTITKVKRHIPVEESQQGEFEFNA